MSQRDEVLAAVGERSEQSLAELVEFARIPGVSAAGFDPAQVERSAQHAAGLVSDAGFEHAEVLELDGAHPYVLADWLHAGADAPTVLIYAHHDVQPPGREERWLSPPFEPTRRDDGRLYGRGVVDDKAGLLLHLAAARAWLAVAGALPVNVKLIVEGEEEIGSPHLAAFLREQGARLDADVIVLSDTANLDTGLPSLTTSLRGLVSVDVTVRALEHPLHSGMWGGPVLDAATALVRLLARLVDDAGRSQLAGLEDDVPTLNVATRAELEALPFDEAAFRADAGLLGSSLLGGSPSCSVYERLWWRPAIAVTALEALPLATAANQLIDRARARVGVRLAPGQDPERVRALLLKCLQDDPPWGVDVVCEAEACVPGWSVEPLGPAYEAARRALATGFGREPVSIGCGGTIPFVGPFQEVMAGPPALLLGLEDPICNAHGENESLCLDDFRKASLSAAALLAELSNI